MSFRLLQLIIMTSTTFSKLLCRCPWKNNCVVSWFHSFSSNPVVPDTMSWSHFDDLSDHMYLLCYSSFTIDMCYIVYLCFVKYFESSTCTHSIYQIVLFFEYVQNDCIALSTVYLWKIERKWGMEGIILSYQRFIFLIDSNFQIRSCLTLRLGFVWFVLVVDSGQSWSHSLTSTSTILLRFSWLR